MKYSPARWLLHLMLVLLVAIMVVPLLYLLLIALLALIPLLAVYVIFFEDRPEYRVTSLFDIIVKLGLLFIITPAIILGFAAPVRAVILFGSRAYPPFYNWFNEVHQPLYDWLARYMGDLSQYWFDFYLGLIGILVIFMLSIYDSYRRSMLVNLIRNLPTSTVRGAAIGLVELKDKVVPADGNIQQPVIRYYYDTEGEGGRFSEKYPFYLDDGTGRVLVDPRECAIAGDDHMFEVGIHQVVLKMVKAENNLAEGRLMPGDEAYVLGTLQINHDEKDKVVLKPNEFSIKSLNFYDLFFISNKGEKELLAAFEHGIRRGWSIIVFFICLAGWFSIYSWTNIQQISNVDLEVVPDWFRVVSQPAELERTTSVAGYGNVRAIELLQQLDQGDIDTEAIMQGLSGLRLEKLAVPELQDMARMIDHPGFGAANNWLRELDVNPAGHWGHEYPVAEYMDADESVIHRIKLDYRDTGLYASYRANCSGVLLPAFEIRRRTILFRLTDQTSGTVFEEEVPCQEGRVSEDGLLLFGYLRPGDYDFIAYPLRAYTNGNLDGGAYNPESQTVTIPSL